MSNYIALDATDKIVSPLAIGADATFIDNGWKGLQARPLDETVIFRSMSQRKTVNVCNAQNRNYLYIDTGYIGNMQKRKDWHRIVHNGMQHSNINWDLPNDRFEALAEAKPYLRFPGWKKDGTAILLVTPSDKPCKFYGINRDDFVNSTIEKIRQHTDRPIIIRDKVIRRDRVGLGSIYNQLDDDNIFAVVTYNSIAATEAVGYGVPCFTLAPNAADFFCEKDLSKIETPKYAAADYVNRWQNWLAYCQYTPNEMQDGTALNLIKEHNLS
jgi:hypothetical protein|tara:strand:+ start:68 stop:877 length:810 start_codon:yes stop_codon:yes gene_type:complete